MDTTNFIVLNNISVNNQRILNFLSPITLSFLTINDGNLFITSNMTHNHSVITPGGVERK